MKDRGAVREEDRVVTCTRKKGYRFNEAKRIASRMRRHKDNSAAAEYRCPFCKQWHIGEDHTRELKKAFRKGAGA